jgi:rubrerythrin
MGIIESLTKLVDPVAARANEEGLKVVRETPERDATSAPPELVCRVCGHRSAKGPFCPVCLAQTMERAPRDR